MGLVDEHVVVLITGISAAGKSTVADLLTRRFERGVHVKGDVFRRMVVSGREEMTVEPTDEALRQLELRYRLGASTADAYFEAGFSVVVQDVMFEDALPRAVAAITGRALHVVVLAPNVDAVGLREAARSKTAYRDGGPSIAHLDRALREDTPRIGLWLDTSDQTPDQTVDEIIARAPESRVD